MDFKYQLDMLILQSSDARLKALGCPTAFIRRLHRYIMLLYEDDAIFQTKLGLAREMGDREKKRDEELQKNNQFWRRSTGIIRPKSEKTVGSLLAEQTPMAQTSLARNLAENVQKQHDISIAVAASLKEEKTDKNQIEDSYEVVIQKLGQIRHRLEKMYDT